jgi:hypothetical protein
MSNGFIYVVELVAASDKVDQLLAQGRWFSLSSTTKTGNHDIAEILLKVALKRQKINKQKTLSLVNTIC